MPRKDKKASQAKELNFLHVLKGHQGGINRIAWSPDGSKLASTSEDGTVHVSDVKTGREIWAFDAPRRLTSEIRDDEVISDDQSNATYTVTWSPNGRTLVTGSQQGLITAWHTSTRKQIWRFATRGGSAGELHYSPAGDLIAAGFSDRVIRLLDSKTGKPVREFNWHLSAVPTVTWSPDGKLLASGSFDRTICFWDRDQDKKQHRLEGHSDEIWSLAWSPSGEYLASASKDKTVGIWNRRTGRQMAILEGHTAPVKGISFSFDGRFLASKSLEDVRIWRTDNYQLVTSLLAPIVHQPFVGLAFQPFELTLATSLGDDIAILDLDSDTLLSQEESSESTHYSNAKVVLVGDSGVGKSGLALVLTGQPWAETGSTHGRRVWVLDSYEVTSENGLKETRETLLWDLAGQPDYRLIHQLHLTEVAVALVVFDSRSQTDPFAGVRHWDRALCQAQRVQSESLPPTQKYLVAARVDVGRIGASSDRIEWVRQDLSFDRYLETSAKEGWGVKELADAIRNGIDWQALPAVSSTELFQSIKSFLVEEKESGRLLSSMDDLYRAYLNKNKHSKENEDLRAQFETCIGRVESRGLIQRLSFGNLVLLQPEFQDVYASAIANAVKDEPDGLGCIKEDKARLGEFRMPEGERIRDPEQEKLLLISTVEDLLRHEIALREQGEDGQYLVFPSQLTRENPDLPDPEGKAVIFNFEGPVLNIYATLAVRLCYSGFFRRKDMWKNAATYSTTGRGTCGMFIREINEGRGELTLFFDDVASEESRFQFEEYVRVHLERKSLSQSMNRRRIFVCDKCETPVADLAAKRRRERGFDWIACNVCEPPVRLSLLDREERLRSDPVTSISEMDRAADTQRQLETAASILQGKIATNDFDVFLCHNNTDKPAVKKVAELLKERGILPWLDEWELRPGLNWQRLLEQQIKQIKSAAVFVGENGMGPWQQRELEGFLSEFVDRDCPVIPVLLENAPKKPELPVFLKAMTWVDFRKDDPAPLGQLIWGITGQREFGREFDRSSLLK